MKKRASSTRKLQLTTQTLRLLSRGQLHAVGGGDTNDGGTNGTSKYTKLGCADGSPLAAATR